MTELRKCPFCGGDDIALAQNENYEQFCFCHKCRARGGVSTRAIDKGPEIIWNTRTPDIELILGDIQAMYDLILTDKIPNPYLYGKKDMLERVLSLLETEKSK